MRIERQIRVITHIFATFKHLSTDYGIGRICGWICILGKGIQEDPVTLFEERIDIAGCDFYMFDSGCQHDGTVGYCWVEYFEDVDGDAVLGTGEGCVVYYLDFCGLA